MTGSKRGSLLLAISMILTLSLVLSGCGLKGSSSTLKASGKTYKLSPGFVELYESLGGEEVMGPAISKLFDYDSRQCQYTVNTLLCLNPLETGEKRLLLYPLGNLLDVSQKADSNINESGSMVVNGFVIYDEFVPLYEQFGKKYTGQPISKVHLNYQLQRIEQFFENVGFYRKFSDTPGNVKLIAYGAASCTTECDYRPAQEAMIMEPSAEISDLTMLDNLTKTDDVSVFGKPLTQVYLAADGMQEQVYENIILYSVVDSKVVKLRPLPSLVGITGSEPVEKKPEKPESMIFYATGGGKGYYVSAVFDTFIDEHGGSLYSGDPISSVAKDDSGAFQQCFTNYCLAFSPAKEGSGQVSLVPLGSQYLQLVQDSISAQQPAEITSQTVKLKVAQEFQQVSNADTQKIDVFITSKDNQQPLAGIETELRIALPDGSVYIRTLPATQADGRSSISITDLKKLPNGSILTYQICLKSTLLDPVCRSGSYLLWTNP